MDLIKSADASEFKKYKKQSDAIKEIHVKWNCKMKLLEQKGYGEKEALSLRSEQKRIENLEYLKKLSGPFTKKEEIELYMNNGSISDEEKCKRLYAEVKYARSTSQTLKTSAAVFRLRQKGKKLSIQEYAHNLCQYLDDTQAVSTLTLNDLNDVLSNLKHQSIANSQQLNDAGVEEVCEQQKIKVGMHIAVAWVESETNVNWHLGVVERVEEDGFVVSHMVRTSKNNIMTCRTS